jgi:uncharacterized membrane protein YagU involved in acid resistance
MNQLVKGALAGLIATVPMTIAMKLMHQQLPPKEKYPLPPRAITMELADRAGVKKYLDEDERYGLTVISHFGYGATVGAFYAPLAPLIPLPASAAGASYGVLIWAGSYLGWLPAMSILRPATRHPARRNALMISAHVLWGVCAGLLVEALKEEQSSSQTKS